MCIRDRVWQIEQQLDVDAMKTAAKYLVGTHDFAAFTSAKNKKKSTVRSIESILFEQNGAEMCIRDSSIPAGMAIYDTMKFIKCDVSTICIGMAASMGAFLLAGGTRCV